MTRALSHRQRVPFMVSIPDEPDAIRLIRIMLLFINYTWQHKEQVFLLMDNINAFFDLVESVLDVCMACYEYYERLLCKVKSGLNQIASSSI